MKKDLKQLQQDNQAPSFLTEEGMQILSSGYLLEGETPRDAYERVAKAIVEFGEYKKDILEDIMFITYKNPWLGYATPVLSNSGTDRGLPLSCYIIDVQDSIEGILQDGVGEMALLSKVGGGVGVNFNNIRHKGSPIRGGQGGLTDGVIPFAKAFDSAIMAAKQPKVRRGSASLNLDIEHLDFNDFVDIRRPEGDINRQCLNINNSVSISDSFMHRLLAGDSEARDKWLKLMKARIELGEPYMLFTDTVNRANPPGYKRLGFNNINYSNICCLTGDTLVVTKEGPKKIESLVGRDVEIFDGNTWVECGNFKVRGETKELVEVTIKSGQKFKCTLNHRWFVARTYSDIREDKYKEVTANDLQVGDFIQDCVLQSHGSSELTSAYLKGFLLGDGTLCNRTNKPILNVHSTKYMCIDQLVESAKQTPYVVSTKVNTEYEVSASEEVINASGGVQIFKRIKGLTSRKQELAPWASTYKKQLPNDFLEWDKQSKLYFLAGLLDADGTCGKAIQVASVHRVFIENVRDLLFSLGVVSNLDVQTLPSGREAYRLSISSTDSYELLQTIPCKRLKFEGKKPNRMLTGYRKVIAVDKIQLEQAIPVYCPNIPSTGKFALLGGVLTGNSEILQYADKDHTVTCCLSSLNLEKYDEWKEWRSPRTGMSVPELGVYILDAIMEEFIQKASNFKGLSKAKNGAIKGRSIGLGAMGYHAYLQSKMLPFDSFESYRLNNEMFSFIKKESDKASMDLAVEKGEPEWCKGTGFRNAHRTALAPTKSNAVICSDTSASIEAYTANAFTENSAKGSFIRKNKFLKKVLADLGLDTPKVWDKIARNGGSVQTMKELDDHTKQVFLTAYEINQEVFVRQAAQRQPYICQSQSLNLFFPHTVNPKYFSDVHILAWELGVKTLYYCKSTKATIETYGECVACHA